MNAGLDRINLALAREAESMFRVCCSSAEWASRMTSSRPFKSEAELMQKAADIWNNLQVSDWLEAFAAHPKIGDTKTTSSQQKQSALWSAGEQSGVISAGELLRHELAEANRKYVDKFGFIFIVCATGKSGAEMLDICQTRLGNDRDTEIANAAAEQQKITEIRLKKLLSQ
jgi:2-oxo-4-hydroxy-4-carboxy-5-ureidoimidazoline decarboxylase